MKNKYQLINKLYNDDSVRIYVILETKQYYISIYDVVQKLTNYKNIKNYIITLKKKLLLDKCDAIYNFKTFYLVKGIDGKCVETEMIDLDSLIDIIEYIPLRNKSYFMEFE